MSSDSNPRNDDNQQQQFNGRAGDQQPQQNGVNGEANQNHEEEEEVHENGDNEAVELVYGSDNEEEDEDEDDLYWHELHEESGEPEQHPQNSDDDAEDEEEDDGRAHSPSAAFDPELPIRHSYLGEGMAPLQGRTLLDEDTILEIPLIVMGLHLVPGQTLPMTVYHTAFQNAIRRSVVKDRLVGLVSNGIGSIDGRTVVNAGALGTLAEIYEFQEEDDSEARNVFNLLQGSGFNFAFKAKGRQRFNVIEVRRQADGNLMGKIKIRPEVVLHPLPMEVVSGGGRFISPDLPTPTPASVFASEINEVFAENGAKTEEEAEMASTKALNQLIAQNQNRRQVFRHYSVYLPLPSFVYEFYDENILVERVHKKLRSDLKGLTESHANIPMDASELSFWIAQNFIMDDSIRLKILKMDSAIQRLRFELSLLDNVSRVISCRRCQLTIADQTDIFAMSKEGPQGTYVNPQGFIHETLTVHKARDIIYRGAPSTESSWFPGYSWTITECRGCRQHLGWKFRATGRVTPKKFWGLARKSVTFKYDFNPESNDPDLLERRSSRTSTTTMTRNSTTSIGNGYEEVGPHALTLPPLLPAYPYTHGR